MLIRSVYLCVEWLPVVQVYFFQSSGVQPGVQLGGADGVDSDDGRCLVAALTAFLDLVHVLQVSTFADADVVVVVEAVDVVALELSSKNKIYISIF
jgi:hypothetical protein